MSPDGFLRGIVDPGLRVLEGLGGPFVTGTARKVMLAIALQESGPGLEARYQNSPAVNPGPARGFWQFEQGGGTAGVLQHAASRELALQVCERFCVVSSQSAVWRALEGHDLLAACFARLLLLTDPRRLPDAELEGWECYMRLWRPGKPHASVWANNWNTADRIVREVSPLVS